jgi:hypothetical protein
VVTVDIPGLGCVTATFSNDTATKETK